MLEEQPAQIALIFLCIVILIPAWMIGGPMLLDVIDRYFGKAKCECGWINRRGAKYCAGCGKER